MVAKVINESNSLQTNVQISEDSRWSRYCLELNVQDWENS